MSFPLDSHFSHVDLNYLHIDESMLNFIILDNITSNLVH